MKPSTFIKMKELAEELENQVNQYDDSDVDQIKRHIDLTLAKILRTIAENEFKK
jgi:hypothetical protein